MASLDLVCWISKLLGHIYKWSSSSEYTQCLLFYPCKTSQQNKTVKVMAVKFKVVSFAGTVISDQVKLNHLLARSIS